MEDFIRKHEGKHQKMYIDSLGNLIIGIGHNLNNGLPDRIIEQLFEYDLTLTMTDVKKYLPWAVRIHAGAYMVLIDMAFNMGVHGLLSFHKFLDHMEKGEYTDAIYELRDSKYFIQVPHRVEDQIAELKKLI